MTSLRGLSAIRLSVLTDESTSEERQRAANRAAAAAEGVVIEHEAVDLGVSASRTTPFERPDLGEWLQRPDLFDAILFWRFDRAVRSMSDLNEFVDWARKHRKVLIFAEGASGRLVLDFRKPSDPVTQLMLSVFAFSAEMETTAIKERVTGAMAALRQMPLRFRGSRPPYGYVAVPLEGGGYTLGRDNEAVAVLERVIGDVFAGKTLSAVSVALNSEGVPSPRDHHAVRRGRATGGFLWSSSTLRERLTSPALIGWKMSAGKPVRDGEGNPIPCTTDPVLTRPEYDAILAELSDRSTAVRTDRADTNALLLRVAHCASCEGRMYLNHRAVDKHGGHYKCTAYGQGRHCPNPVTVRGDWLDAYVTERFLAQLGDWELTHTRVIPGYDPQPEIEETAAEYRLHADQPVPKSEIARRIWREKGDALDARLTSLSGRRRVEPRTEIVKTGKTFGDEWEAGDTAARRALLHEAGARVTVKRGSKGGWRTLDVRRVMFSVTDDHFSELSDALADARSNPTTPPAMQEMQLTHITDG